MELCICSFSFRKLLKEMRDFAQALRNCQLVSIVQQLKAKLESPGKQQAFVICFFQSLKCHVSLCMNQIREMMQGLECMSFSVLLLKL